MQVDVAGKELSKFQAEQEGKFKGLQRLVAEFVVEKNEQMEALTRAVSEMKAASRQYMSE